MEMESWVRASMGSRLMDSSSGASHGMYEFGREWLFARTMVVKYFMGLVV